MSVARKQLYEVIASEKTVRRTEWDVCVLAESVRQARRLGIEALEKKGLINRRNIHKTSVHCTGDDVWVEV